MQPFQSNLFYTGAFLRVCGGIATVHNSVRCTQPLTALVNHSIRVRVDYALLNCLYQSIPSFVNLSRIFHLYRNFPLHDLVLFLKTVVTHRLSKQLIIWHPTSLSSTILSTYTLKVFPFTSPTFFSKRKPCNDVKMQYSNWAFRIFRCNLFEIIYLLLNL